MITNIFIGKSEMSMKKKWTLAFVTILLLISNFLTACGSGPQNELEGTWVWDWLSSSSGYLAGDLTFEEGKSLVVTEAFAPNPQNLRYAVIAPGKVKITIDDVAIVADFEIEEDVLTIKFDDGRNYYQRVETTPVIENEETKVGFEPIQEEPSSIPTQPNVNEIALPSSTPRPTDTPIPVVVQAPTATKASNFTPTPQVYSPLSRCAASRLHVGDSAYVNFETGRIGMRSEPVATIGDKLVRKLEEGEIIHIIDGPKCDLGWIFWKVRTVYSETGWIPEGDGIEFWVVPIATYDVCSGAKPTRLRVGDRAFVEPEPEDYNRIYPEPAIDSTKLLYRMSPGSYMEVLEGPSCGSGRTGVWWYVRSEDSGIEGWTRESDYSKSYYFIAPVIQRP